MIRVATNVGGGRFVIREISLEHAGQRELEAAGYVAEKRGRDGWPDREVYVAPRTHEWIEWKRPGGRLTPAQERRVPKMRERGEVVHVIDDLRDLLTIMDLWRIKYGPPPLRDVPAPSRRR